MKKLIIRNGTLVNPEVLNRNDIYIENGTIQKIASFIDDKPGAEILDAKGKLIFSGGIDPHVHMSLPSPAGPSSDDFYSGSRAAIAGGTTTIMDFVTPEQGESLIRALDKRRREAESSLIDTSLHMGITWWSDQVQKDILSCILLEGIRSFKTYLAYRRSIGIDYETLEKVMRVVGQNGGMVMVHCEEGEEIELLQQSFLQRGLTSPVYHALSRPSYTEYRAVRKVMSLSRKTKCPVYIVHVSAAESVYEIRQAREEGLPVYAETCPHYLLLGEEHYKEQFAKSAPYILSPPLRTSSDREALWKALADGTIQTVATDHCPFNFKGQKDCGLNDFSRVPNGAGSVEYRLSLLYTFGVLQNRISLRQFAGLISGNAAGIFGLENKGKITEGYIADMVIWDPVESHEISVKNQYQLCDSNIYEGFKVRGKPCLVLKRGEILNF